MKKSTFGKTDASKEEAVGVQHLHFDWRAPANGLEKLIKSYWFISSRDNDEKKVQKIVPDGYPEIIFHFADPYMIRLKSDWELQPPHLLAGQIKKHFYLGNTGKSDIAGVKLNPTALTHLFGLHMDKYTDKVVQLEAVLGGYFSQLVRQLEAAGSTDKKCDALNTFFLSIAGEKVHKETAADEAVTLILSSNGTVTVRELCRALSLSERQLERLFKQYVGLPPKFYARVIRFSQIFKHIQKGDPFWTNTVYRTGFYDQAHFIKNFKEFTGEEPSEYLFEELNIANFFLNK